MLFQKKKSSLSIKSRYDSFSRFNTSFPPLLLFWFSLYKRAKDGKGFSITQMPRKSARQGVPINKFVMNEFVMNEIGGTNPKPPPIKKKRTPANKRFHYEKRTTGKEPKVKVSATDEGTHTVISDSDDDNIRT